LFRIQWFILKTVKDFCLNRIFKIDADEEEMRSRRESKEENRLEMEEAMSSYQM
jgi:hypothetical protein